MTNDGTSLNWNSCGLHGSCKAFVSHPSKGVRCFFTQST